MNVSSSFSPGSRQQGLAAKTQQASVRAASLHSRQSRQALVAGTEWIEVPHQCPPQNFLCLLGPCCGAIVLLHLMVEDGPKCRTQRQAEWSIECFIGKVAHWQVQAGSGRQKYGNAQTYDKLTI